MRAMLLAPLILVCAATPSASQRIGRDQYFSHLPPMPKLVSATLATERFHLFGDTSLASYRDANLDGIDDQQAEWLKDLAAHFAPILRRNNFSLPRDFRLAAGGKLRVTRDVFRGSKLVRTDTIEISAPGWPAASLKASGTQGNDEVDAVEANDSALVRLLQASSPRGGELRHEPAEGDSTVVLFIDFPGSEPESWRRAYRDARDVAVYVHPFIDELDSEHGSRFALVLQYWFFYPFNDSANNHEGDFEHINVVITSEALSSAFEVNARLTETQLSDLIENRTVGAGLSIASVEYYFHSTFTTLDYVGARRGAHGVLTSKTRNLQPWADQDYIDRIIRERMSDPLLATHPVGYIGGNNRGPDEFSVFLPRFGAAYNRNSHGTYPLPGTWQSVGPMLATEKLSGLAVPVIAQTMGDTLAFADPNFMLFHRSEIVLVPDWERVDRLMEHPAARSEWAWLVLPLRWGFPATESLGAGLLANTDVGQVAPEGPARQPTWNRLGYRTGWREFKPQTLRVLMVPTSPTVYVNNGWGVLNVPLIFVGAMPGWSVALTQVLPWVSGALNLLGSPPAKTYYPGEPPFRFSSIGPGLSRSSGGAGYARLLSKAGETESTSLARKTDLTTVETVETLNMHPSLRFHFNLFYGRKISAENSLTFADADLVYDESVSTSGSTSRTHKTGTMAFRELLGGFRLNAWSTNDDEMQFYGRGGYGYSWYKFRNISINDVPDDYVDKAGYAPTLYPSAKWWPNTWYIGAGTELFTPKKLWLLDRLGVGARVDVTMSWHALFANYPGKANLGWVRRNEIAFSLLTAW